MVRIFMILVSDFSYSVLKSSALFTYLLFQWVVVLLSICCVPCAQESDETTAEGGTNEG